MTPRAPQPKMASKRAQYSRTCVKMAPQMVQESPGPPQDGSKRPNSFGLDGLAGMREASRIKPMFREIQVTNSSGVHWACLKALVVDLEKGLERIRILDQTSYGPLLENHYMGSVV
eukprot:4925433-Pyramimonas_sp.AAC.1